MNVQCLHARCTTSKANLVGSPIYIFLYKKNIEKLANKSETDMDVTSIDQPSFSVLSGGLMAIGH